MSGCSEAGASSRAGANPATVHEDQHRCTGSPQRESAAVHLVAGIQVAGLAPALYGSERMCGA